MSRVLTVRISDEEFSAFLHIRAKHMLTTQELLHAVIVDALVDEGYDGIRCRESEGCESARETSEAGGPTA